MTLFVDAVKAEAATFVRETARAEDNVKSDIWLS